MALMTSRQQSEFISAVVRHLPCDLIPADVAQYYISNPRELAALLERFVPEQAIPAVPRPKIVRRIKLRIDRSVLPADMLRATGCDYIRPWMLSHCLAWKGTARIGGVEVCLIDMGRDWLRDEALAAIDELGLVRSPDNAPLWTLSKEQPELQRETWVMDPGTVWQNEHGKPCFACVDGGSGNRDASLGSVSVKWLRFYHVLALSK